MRLIDADELINVTKRGAKFASLFADDDFKIRVLRVMRKFIQRSINDAPTIDAVPVKHGKWKYKNDEDFDYVPCCSICGEPDALSRNDYNYRGGKIRDNNSNYCPNCGAKMDGGEEE